MVVVLDAPGLKREGEGHEHEGANNVLHEVVAVEAAVAGVMTHDEETREGGSCEGPGDGKEVPGGDGDKVEAGRHGDDGGEDGTPGLAMVELKDLGGHGLHDII